MTGRPPNDATDELLGLLGGKWVTAAISAAASLGLADALAAGPLDVEALARAVGAKPEPLRRLLRVLAGEGLFEESVDGRYATTTLGDQLRADALRNLAVFVGSPFMWTPWAELADAIRTGEAAFAKTHGQDLFDYLETHADEARVYHAAVDAFTRRQARGLAEAFDFADVETVVDVGGGLGTLLVELLGRFATLRGILFDLPRAAEQARAALHEAGVADRCEVASGSFFEGVPEGADVYVVKHVIHNWADDEATTILRNCARAVSPRGHVLVIDGVLLPGNRRDATRLLDLEMLALCGPGRERSKPELRALMHAAGLRLVGSADLAGTARLLVGAPRG